MAEKPLTKKQIMGHLGKLNSRWNSKYWIFAADGGLYLMKYGKDGERMLEHDDISMSQDAIMGSYQNLNADGGDW